jgi:hypothetical protein
MTQYTKFSKNLFSNENYIPVQSNIKLNLNTNLTETKNPVISSPGVTSTSSNLISNTPDAENFGVNLSNTITNNAKQTSSNSQNGFTKPICISNLNVPNNSIMNKNDRIKSSTILRSNTMKYPKSMFESNYNQIPFSLTNHHHSGINSNKTENDNNDGTTNTPRQNKKSVSKMSISNTIQQHNLSIDGSKRDFLTVLSNIHRASSINLSREKTNLSSYFSTSPNIYAKNYSTDSVNSINNVNTIIQREKTQNLKNSDSSLNLSSFSNNNYTSNFNNIANIINNTKSNVKRHQTVSFRNNLKTASNNRSNNSNDNNSINNINNNNNNTSNTNSNSNNNIRSHNSNDTNLINNNNAANNFYQLNESKNKINLDTQNSKIINQTDNVDKNTINEKNSSLILNEIQFSSKYSTNQNQLGDFSNKIHNFHSLNSNNFKIFDSNLNFNLMKKKTANLLIKKRSQKLETNESVNNFISNDDETLNQKELNTVLKLDLSKENKILNSTNKLKESETELIDRQLIESDQGHIKTKVSNHLNDNLTKKNQELENEVINSDEEESLNKLINSNEKTHDTLRKSEMNHAKILSLDSKIMINNNNNNNNHLKKTLFNEEQNELNGLTTNIHNHKINRLEINLDKFDSLKKLNYYSQNSRTESHINKINSKNNNKQFITSVVQPLTNSHANFNSSLINNNALSNYRLNKNNLDLILIPQQSLPNENNKTNNEITNYSRSKIIRTNSKLSYISRDVNDSYAYTNVQQYIEENELMTPEKHQSIKKWIKDVNFWYEDWEKRTIELNIEDTA